MKRAAVSSILVAVVLLTLGVTAEARMNVPGRAEGNWSWRCTEEMMSAADFDSLRELTKSSNRLEALFVGTENLRRRYEAGSTTFSRPSSTTRY